MDCRKCGHELAEDSIFCAKCGTKKEDVSEGLYKESQDDSSEIIPKSKKFSKKQQIGIIVIVTVLVVAVLAVTGWQHSLANRAKKLYDISEYEAAYDTRKYIMNTASLGNYKDKIDIMYNITVDYDRWKQSDSDEKIQQVFAWLTLQKCVGYSLAAQESGCVDEVIAMASDVIQWLHERNYNIQDNLTKQLQKSSFDFKPLSDTVSEEDVEDVIDAYASLVPGSN